MKAIIIFILLILGILTLRKKTRIIIHRHQPHHPPEREGEVTIDTSGSKYKSKGRDEGEYVDYTEVKE